MEHSHYKSLFKNNVVAVDLLPSVLHIDLTISVLLPKYGCDLLGLFLRGILSTDQNADLMICEVHPGCQHVLR